MAAAKCKESEDDCSKNLPATEEEVDYGGSSPDCAAGEQQAGPAKRSREETEDNNHKPTQDSKHIEAAKEAKRNHRAKQQQAQRNHSASGVPAGQQGLVRRRRRSV